MPQSKKARACKFFHSQLKIVDMQINAILPWAHPQSGNASLPSYIGDNSSLTSYIGKGKTCKPMHIFQKIVMVTRAKKDALASTPSPFGSRPRAFNSAGIMTRSQLVATAKTPWTPSRRLPTTRRTSIASPIMFYHGIVLI